MTLLRQPSGLLLRTPSGELTHDMQCCCTQASDCTVCSVGSVPASITVDIDGMLGAFGNCNFCETGVDGEIEHGYLSCENLFDRRIEFNFEAYTETFTEANCGSYEMTRNVVVWYYMQEEESYPAYTLRGRYRIVLEFLGFPRRIFIWEWDKAVMAYGGYPFNCTTLFNLLDFGTATAPDGGPCDTFANPTISYVIG